MSNIVPATRRAALVGFVLGLTMGLLPCMGADGALRRLRVSEDHRYLSYEDGTPFFYLGDTAWELFHRLDRAQADRYLENRAEKGFTVIQAVVLAQLGGLTDPNPYGDLPLTDNDPGKPNEAYFRHVDYIVDKAQELGLFVGMLPTWGSHWKSGVFDVDSARVYGRFLGTRYRDKAIIWILGGDQNINSDGEARIIEAMARGLKQGDGGHHLVTYHPRGPGLSSDYFHKADWLDFNMFQSSHGARDHDNGLFTEHDYALQPPKPTLDGEPRYETIPVGFYNSDAVRTVRFDAYDVRQAAYWSLLAGACGHTYGHNSIWQMWQPGRSDVISPAMPWSEALDHPGAFQMGYIRKLFESRPFQKLRPGQVMLVDGPAHGGAKVRAACAVDGSFAFIYSAQGASFTVDLSVIRAARVAATWFDPRYGLAEPLHTSDNVGYQTFAPPTSGRGADWLLVLDDANASFPPPGQSRQ